MAGIEGALRDALGNRTQYRRATGASRDTREYHHSASTTAVDDAGSPAAPPTRPPVGTVPPLPRSAVAELSAPILQAVQGVPLYDVIGASTQVVVVDIDSPLSVAFIAATESRVSSVLLWDDAAHTFVGMLTVTDYIRILLHCHNSSSDDSAEEVVALSVRDLLQVEWMNGRRRGARKSDFVWSTPNLNVLDCLAGMMLHRLNRLPVLASKAYEDEDTAPEPCGIEAGAASLNEPRPCPPPPSSFSIVTVVTFPQLLSHIGELLLPAGRGIGTLPASSSPSGEHGCETLYDVPLYALGVGRNLDGIRSGKIKKLDRNAPVAEALKVMIDASVHAVCILDEQGRIEDVFTRADVLRLEFAGAYHIGIPLNEALSSRPPVRDAVVCCLNDTFGDVLAHFVETWVKEMFVIDPTTEEVVGQLSMKEVLYFLYETTRAEAAASSSSSSSTKQPSPPPAVSSVA